MFESLTVCFSKPPRDRVAFVLALLTVCSPTFIYARQISKRTTQTLEFGRPIEGSLSTGKIDTYLIKAPAGEYIQIAAEQIGIDLQLALVAPDHKRVIAVDIEKSKSATEVVSVVTQVAGTYVLEVSPVGMFLTSSQYKMRIDVMRPATDADRAHAAAMTTLVNLLSALNTSDDAEIRHANIETAERLVDHFHSRGDTTAEVHARLALSRILADLGDKVKAGHLDEETVQLCRTRGNKAELAGALNSLGQIYEFTGQIQKALDTFAEALPLMREVGMRSAEADVLINTGWVYFSSGDWQKALDYYSRALAIARELNNRHAEAFALLSMGGAYTPLGEKEKALGVYRQALKIHQLTKSKRGEAYTLHDMAWLFNSMGQTRKALEYNNRALPLMQSVGDRHGEAYILANIGFIYRSLNQLAKAAYYYGLSLPLRRAVNDRSGEAETLYNLADIERIRRNFEAARIYIESAVKIAEQVRASVGSQDLRATYSGTRHDYYELYVDVLMQTKAAAPSHPTEALALEINERSRARSLVDLLHEARVDIRSGVDADLLHKEQELETEVNAKTDALIRMLNGKHSEQQAAQLRREIEERASELEALQGRIRLASPHYAALTQLNTATVPEIEALLDPDTILLEYALGTERSYLWLVSNDEIRSVTLSKRATLEATASRVYASLTARARHIPNETLSDRQARLAKADAQFQVAAAELSRELLAPIKDRLGGKRLAIVSDGALQYIPFAALPDPKTLDSSGAAILHAPLINDHEVVNLPSASTLALLREASTKRPVPPKTAIVFADPVFESTDIRVQMPSRASTEKAFSLTATAESPATYPDKQLRDFLSRAAWTEGSPLARLPYSRTEAMAVADLIPESQRKIVLDFDVNYEAVTSPELANYRFIHFSTHGLLDPNEPELSGVLLSLVDKNGQPQRNGILRLGEVYNLRLPVDTVTLSACETALGKSIKGEGLVGITRGFMYAGALRVMASLWKVDDVATSDLMRAFYRGVLGPQSLRPSAALRQAQQQMWQREKTRSPFYWAGFVMQGDWR